MGDRSFCQFLIPRALYLANKARIDDIVQPECDNEHEGLPLVTLDCPDCQGGGYQETIDLREAGIAHLTYWEAGIEYEAGGQAFIPGEETVDVRLVGSALVVAFDEEGGAVSEDEIEDCRAFIRIRKLLEAGVTVSPTAEAQTRLDVAG